MNRLLLACTFGLALAFATPALGHGGGTNKCGCHFNRTTGECHCHRPTGVCGCECQPSSCKAPSPDESVSAGTGDDVFMLCKDVKVKGHTKKDGTYVAPHHRSSPDETKSNNYGTKGNYNPYTGEEGKKDPYSTSPKTTKT
jgi:hypothetical protein